MKSIYKYSLLLLLVFAVGVMLQSCSDEDSGGTPFVSFIRVTNPASSDSLLSAAGQGQMVVIMGGNLQTVREVWFNNRQSSLTPTFITSSSIITRIPTKVPSIVNNKMKMVFANGDSLLYDFTIDISKPRIDYMKSEYVNEGDVAYIYGNYFYEPLTVSFPGGLQGEVVSLEDEAIAVKVPAGAQPGPIVIASNFGETTSGFWFKDNRNIVASFDGSTDGLWHGPDFVVSSDDDITNIENKFIRAKEDLAAWAWFELYVGQTGAAGLSELKNIPADAFANPGNYSLKFEINTLKSLTGAAIHMYIGPDMPGKRNNVNYNWQPNLNTNGLWETVTIPWEDVYTANQSFPYNPAGYDISIHFSGASAVSADFGLDNMRVVPNN